MGESTSDFFVFRINPYAAVILGGIVFAIALKIQFSAKKYVPWIYWFAVTMVAVFGTMAADVLHIQLGVPYIASTIFFAVILALVFIVWRGSEKTLSIHTVNNPRREIFYWVAVFATFALGTAAGDWAAISLGLGYFSAGLLFTAVILIPAIGFWLFGLNEILSFWFAYIITRPLGASFADWFGKSHSVGGLGLGDGGVSIVLTSLIILCVLYMSFNRGERRAETAKY
ncbi:MAG TPA: hypothetical protein VFP35_02805 [Candidatus Saccharimonadales bacterium]|nr:hypothetical protein [Candidatus Saccharimonadales bacterium]